ncbi:MAG: O-antigen ligase family protein [Candidatus Omnitrophica bacterium]|nr:O-antigen ligase family protein [Candidatus Omnitrophota bacterium]
MKNKIITICDKIIEVCFYGLLVTVTFSTSFVECFSSLMIAAWIVRTILDRKFNFVSTIPAGLIAIYALWVLLSCFNSAYFKESFRGIFKVAEYFMLFIIAAVSPKLKERPNLLINVFLGTALLTCVNGFFQYIFGFDFLRHRVLVPNDFLRRISSSFVHPNDFGAYLMVGVLMLIALVFAYKYLSKLKVLSIVVVSFVMLVCLFMTDSRGAWLSFIAGLLILGLLLTRRVLAMFVGILLIVFVMLPYTAQHRILSVANVKEGTTWERLMLWRGTIDMIKVHPILGFGINTYSRNFPKYKPAEYPDMRYTHNCYLQMASEIGIVGALLFIIFLLTVFIVILRNIGHLKDDKRKYIILGLFAGLVGFALNCIVDTHLYSVNLDVFFYLLLGFVYSLSFGSADEK